MATVANPAVRLRVPTELEGALDPAWLGRALAPVSGGAPVAWVGRTGTIETMAAKVLFQVRFEGDPAIHHFCLKAFLGDRAAGGAAATALREARFYTEIAPAITTRTPRTIAVIDEEAGAALLLMDDLTHAGAHFCSALEPFTPAMAAGTLDQIARLHAGSALLAGRDWIPSRIAYLATAPHFDAVRLQALMDHPRFAALSPRTRDAGLLLAGMARLRDRHAGEPETLLHGDCHAGNFYVIGGEPGLTDWQLLQRGHWAYDVAYHIAAVLPVADAERHERDLLGHYLASRARHGGQVPDAADAWDEYRAAQINGYYHWAITTKVDPVVTDAFVARLGAGVDRHGTYGRLGL